MIEKVANSMTVPTRAHVPFPRSGVDALSDWIIRSMRYLARAEMFAVCPVFEAAEP